MHYKRSLAATVLLLASSAAQADTFDSFGARVSDTIESHNGTITSHAYSRPNSCEMASLAAGTILNAANPAAVDVIEGDAIEQAKQEDVSSSYHHHLALAKASTYDLSAFSSVDDFTDQYYEDCVNAEKAE